MQVSKTFSGAVTLEEETVKRLASYGATGTISVYPSKVDTINEIIADFLRGTCGVDAWYGPAGDEDDSFLWIYGAPFLFGFTTTSASASFYGPLNSSTLNGLSGASATASPTIFNGSTGEYSFSLVFAGNPDNGFCLRFKSRNSSTIGSTTAMRFMKCTNLINGRDAVVFSGSIQTYSTASSGMTVTYMNGVDLFRKYEMDPASFSKNTMTYTSLLRTKDVHRISNEGALPLVPLCVGPYRANGIYLRPTGFDLPKAVGASVEVQTEITISGRSFLLTNSDTFSTGYINMGLIETT